MRIAPFILLLSGTALAEPPARIKVIVHPTFGAPDVLRLEEVDKPVPTDDEVLVRVRAASVNPLDWHYLEGLPYLGRMMEFGLLAPRVTRFGVDFAGTIEAVGKRVTQLKAGDEVFGGQFGAFGEYVTIRADDSIVRKPANITFEQAASIPIAGGTALEAVRDQARVQPGQKVLINGASGGVGTFAVQFAKLFGGEVTGVCSTRNVELVRSIGADHVIDYTKADFTEGGERYDIIIDNVGNRPLLAIRRVLNPSGRYILIGGGGRNDNQWVGPLPRLLRMVALSRVVPQHMGMFLAHMTQQDLTAIGELVASGKVKPVIDRRYSLIEAPQALAYLETGHARGKVVIGVGDIVAVPAALTAPPAKSSQPVLIASVLGFVIAAVTVIPVGLALILNRRFRRKSPDQRSFRWGYYFSIMSFIAGLTLGALLESGAVVVIGCGLLYGALAWLFAHRYRWAWIALTFLSFNPLIWLINSVYLWKRRAEDASI